MNRSRPPFESGKGPGQKETTKFISTNIGIFWNRAGAGTFAPSVAAVSKRNLTTESSIIRTLENSASRRPDPSVHKGLDKCSHRERFFLKKVGIVPRTF